MSIKRGGVCHGKDAIGKDGLRFVAMSKYADSDDEVSVKDQ